MYNVVVCDSDEIYRHKIAEKINAIFPKGCVKVYVYSDGEDFLCDINSICFDIILLDIKLNGMDGITVVENIRENKLCYDSVVIFISSYGADVSKIVDLNPFAYIYKKNLENDLEIKLKKAIRFLMKDNSLSFISQRQHMRIQYKDIIYIQSVKNNLLIYTADDVYNTRSYKMKEVSSLLEDASFVRCHNSFLLNYTYIKRITSKEIELYGGRQIPVSQKHRLDVLNIQK